ncbi:MAG: PSD1 and planctomycete cytochrome C domain-containing protein [Fuerstiella sp.]|nr:PSD1 and planctomycete cytochrome C domain-containing protein [Fuerstiella sp.]
MRPIFYNCFSLLVVWSTHGVADESPRYSTDVRPILAKNCFACHGADEGSREADLRLDMPADPSDKDSASLRAIVPENPADSELVRRVLSNDAELVMPPLDSGHALTKEQIETLRQWIAAGAKFETHWSFVPPVRPSPAVVENDKFSRSDIDRFVLQQLSRKGLTPSTQADPYTLIRRVYLALTGLPPPAEAADAFAKNATAESYESIVDELLQSENFGEHWATIWLDLARYADTKGYEKDQPRNIWRYRDWVIDAFNSDMRFDQFTAEQIAGDLFEDATTEQVLATAFHRNTMTNDEGGTDNEEFRIAAVKDRVDTTIQVWMGLTMGCAKCHSHKYDPISQHEYYRFMAFFNQTEDADRPDDKPRIATPTAEQKRKQIELTARLEQLRAAQKKQPATDSDPDVSQPSSVLAKQIADAQKTLEELKTSITETPIMRELPADKRRTTVVHMRGNFLDHGDTVDAAFPTAFGAVADIGTGSRLDVATWLVSKNNPLTARVTVNRIWSRFFGKGIVETEEDFGTQGMPPSHPELLDWLAVEFRDAHQWSLKQLCKTIVMSATYQQSAAVSDASRKLDRLNRWLSRGPRFRLSAEGVRDQALAVSGLLSGKIGGPSVMPPQPDGLWRTTYSKLKWQTPTGEDRYRRGLYTFLRRTSPYPSMITFDSTSREVCQIRRIRTNTPLQALVTLNDPVYVEAAGALAKTVMAAETSAGLSEMFRRALIRPVSTDELSELSNLFDETLAEFQASPAAAAELLHAAGLNNPLGNQSTRLAALTVVAGVVLNLDETLMRP